MECPCSRLPQFIYAHSAATLYLIKHAIRLPTLQQKQAVLVVKRYFEIKPLSYIITNYDATLIYFHSLNDLSAIMKSTGFVTLSVCVH
jgi:hypothetical protein